MKRSFSKMPFISASVFINDDDLELLDFGSEMIASPAPKKKQEVLRNECEQRDDNTMNDIDFGTLQKDSPLPAASEYTNYYQTEGESHSVGKRLRNTHSYNNHTLGDKKDRTIPGEKTLLLKEILTDTMATIYYLISFLIEDKIRDEANIVDCDMEHLLDLKGKRLALDCRDELLKVSKYFFTYLKHINHYLENGQHVSECFSNRETCDEDHSSMSLITQSANYLYSKIFDRALIPLRFEIFSHLNKARLTNSLYRMYSDFCDKYLNNRYIANDHVMAKFRLARCSIETKVLYKSNPVHNREEDGEKCHSILFVENQLSSMCLEPDMHFAIKQCMFEVGFRRVYSIRIYTDSMLNIVITKDYLSMILSDITRRIHSDSGFRHESKDFVVDEYLNSKIFIIDGLNELLDHIDKQQSDNDKQRNKLLRDDLKTFFCDSLFALFVKNSTTLISRCFGNDLIKQEQDKFILNNTFVVIIPNKSHVQIRSIISNLATYNADVKGRMRHADVDDYFLRNVFSQMFDETKAVLLSQCNKNDSNFIRKITTTRLDTVLATFMHKPPMHKVLFSLNSREDNGIPCVPSNSCNKNNTMDLHNVKPNVLLNPFYIIVRDLIVQLFNYLHLRKCNDHSFSCIEESEYWKRTYLEINHFNHNQEYCPDDACLKLLSSHLSSVTNNAQHSPSICLESMTVINGILSKKNIMKLLLDERIEKDYHLSKGFYVPSTKSSLMRHFTLGDKPFITCFIVALCKSFSRRILMATKKIDDQLYSSNDENYNILNGKFSLLEYCSKMCDIVMRYILSDGEFNERHILRSSSGSQTFKMFDSFDDGMNFYHLEKQIFKKFFMKKSKDDQSKVLENLIHSFYEQYIFLSRDDINQDGNQDGNNGTSNFITTSSNALDQQLFGLSSFFDSLQINEKISVLLYPSSFRLDYNRQSYLEYFYNVCLQIDIKSLLIQLHSNIGFHFHSSLKQRFDNIRIHSERANQQLPSVTYDTIQANMKHLNYVRDNVIGYLIKLHKLNNWKCFRKRKNNNHHSFSTNSLAKSLAVLCFYLFRRFDYWLMHDSSLHTTKTRSYISYKK